MLLKSIARKRRLILAAVLFICGLLLLVKGSELSGWRSEQIELYNQGIEAYLQGDCQTAVTLFDGSYSAYQYELRKDETHYLIYGEPSLELAALANFQKGKCLLILGEVRPAIEAFMESLRLNPGNDYTNLGIATEDIQRLLDQALIVKYDLEFLFRQNQSEEQQSQSGQPGEPAEEGDQPVPGSSQPGQPSSGQGEGGGDDL